MRRRATPPAHLLFALIGLCACSESPRAGDAGVDHDAARLDSITDQATIVDQATGADLSADLGPALTVGEPIVLPLIDEAFYQHTNEATIAAHGGHVVAVYRNRHLLSADGYEEDPENLDPRKNAIAVSHDGGETFALRDNPTVTGSTSDPVVRADAAGRFWFAQLEREDMFSCSIALSEDHGDTWRHAVDGIECGDKEWIAVGDDAIYLAALLGIWKFSTSSPYDQLASQSDEPFGIALAGFVDDRGAHFAKMTSGPYHRVVWDGTGAPQTDDGPIAGSAIDPESGTMGTSIAIGRTLAGVSWVLVEDPVGEVALGLHPPGEDAAFTRLSASDATAFFPAAALDIDGRMHAIWYENDANRGELIYRRSRSADLTQGFEDPLVIDPQAVPTGDWRPNLNDPDKKNRLREYIDLATDGRRAHLIWTRAQDPPSRVMTTYVEHRD